MRDKVNTNGVPESHPDAEETNLLVAQMMDAKELVNGLVIDQIQMMGSWTDLLQISLLGILDNKDATGAPLVSDPSQRGALAEVTAALAGVADALFGAWRAINEGEMRGLAVALTPN